MAQAKKNEAKGKKSERIAAYRIERKKPAFLKPFK